MSEPRRCNGTHQNHLYATWSKVSNHQGNGMCRRCGAAKPAPPKRANKPTRSVLTAEISRLTQELERVTAEREECKGWIDDVSRLLMAARIGSPNGPNSLGVGLALERLQTAEARLTGLLSVVQTVEQEMRTKTDDWVLFGDLARAKIEDWADSLATLRSPQGQPAGQDSPVTSQAPRTAPIGSSDGGKA